jgi:hypothetical protein
LVRVVDKVARAEIRVRSDGVREIRAHGEGRVFTIRYTEEQARELAKRMNLRVQPDEDKPCGPSPLL